MSRRTAVLHGASALLESQVVTTLLECGLGFEVDIPADDETEARARVAWLIQTMADHGPKVLLDVKSSASPPADAAPRWLPALLTEACDILANADVISYDHHLLRCLREECRDLSLLGIVTGRLVDWMGYINRASLDGLVLQPRFIDRILISDCVAAGKTIVAGTCSSDVMVREALSTGVSTLIVDRSIAQMVCQHGWGDEHARG